MAGSSDVPKYRESDFAIGNVISQIVDENAPQRLLQPVNNMKITSGYKNAKYRSMFKCAHFGHDVVSTKGNRTIYASGDGTVVAAGLDSKCGNIVVVKYLNAVNENTGKAQDVLIRYFHLASIAVKVGDKVTKDTHLGIMGKTGILSTGIHLHYEIDTDAREKFACWTPTLGTAGSILKPGTDSTVNPAYFIHTKISAPDFQTICIVTDGYATDADKAMKTIQ